jgi:hypothetical protein
VGGVGGGGGGAHCVATEKNAKIAKLHSIAWNFGQEELVETKLFIKFVKEQRRSFLFLLQILKYLN